MKSLTWIKNKLGPLGWGTLLVFTFWRLGDVASLLTKWFQGKWLTTADFGAIEPMFSVLGILAIPIAALSQTAVKSISRLQAKGQHEQCASLVSHLIMVTSAAICIAAVLLYVSQDLIVSRLHLDSTLYVWILGVMFLATCLMPLSTGLIQGTQRYHYMVITVILGPVLILALTYVLVHVKGLGLRGAFIAKAGGLLLTALVLVVKMRGVFIGKQAEYTEEWKHMKDMLFPMLVFVGGYTLLWHFDRLFVRNFILEDSGGYGAVIALGQLPMWLISPLIYVVFPLASSMHAAGSKLGRILRQSVAFGFLITGLCAIGFGLIAGPVFRYWNTDFAPYSRFVWMYTVAMGLQCLIQIIGSIELARHRYTFLWFMALPTGLMCGGMYLFGRSSLALGSLMVVLIVTRLVILGGMLLCAARDKGASPALATGEG